MHAFQHVGGAEADCRRLEVRMQEVEGILESSAVASKRRVVRELVSLLGDLGWGLSGSEAWSVPGLPQFPWLVTTPVCALCRVSAFSSPEDKFRELRYIV